MQSEVIVVLITAPSKDVGRQIARTLLDLRLAACVSIIPAVNSLYVWQGKIQEDEEVLLLVKTRAELFEDKIIPTVRASHPYQTPEVICLPVVAGLKEYLDWIEEVTKRD
jgi:periplasmic divalent cation tolerance protein